MNLIHLSGNFDKRARKYGLQYQLGMPAIQEQIAQAEQNLSVTFSDQIRMFYSTCNGLVVQEPHLEIFSLEHLIKEEHMLHFAVINRNHQLCFDCSHLNEANQWNIIHYHDGYIITFTFASFWSNKIWAWIDKKREIWRPFSSLNG